MITLFLANLFCWTWRFRNENIHFGKLHRDKDINYLNTSVNKGVTLLNLGKEQPVKKSEHWTLPLLGMLKINVDATFKNEATTIALVAKDSIRKVVHLESSLVSASSSVMAKLSNLHWAFSIDSSKNWANLLWSMDALKIVKEINVECDLIRQNSRYLFLYCRSTLR